MSYWRGGGGPPMRPFYPPRDRGFGIAPLQRPMAPFRGGYNNYRGRGGRGGPPNRGGFKTPGRGEVIRLGPSKPVVAKKPEPKKDEVKEIKKEETKKQPEVKKEPEKKEAEKKETDKKETEKKQPEKKPEEVKKETPEVVKKDEKSTAISEVKAEASKADSSTIQLDAYNSELHLEISGNGLTGSVVRGDGFDYMWAGVRATHGTKTGKVCFEVEILEEQKVQTKEPNKNVCRIGWSVDGSDYQLGEDDQSWGYGGTGKASANNVFKDYGKPFGTGDTITCYMDLVANPMAIFYMLNGEYLGIAYRLKPNELKPGMAVYPHVTVKNMKFRINFGARPPKFKLTNNFVMIQSANNLVTPPPGPQRAEDAEIIMMIGLPGSGKSHWCEKYAQEHKDKKYYILGTNSIIDRMKVTNLKRKRNYHGRWEELIKRSTSVLNKLFSLTKQRPRNYILDQTNVYFTARRRKMESFRGYKRIGAVIVNKPNVLAERVELQKKVEGKLIPDVAMNEMKKNFTLPEAGPSFDDIWFLEEKFPAARDLVEAYRKEGASSKGKEERKAPEEKKPRIEPPAQKSSAPTKPSNEKSSKPAEIKKKPSQPPPKGSQPPSKQPPKLMETDTRRSRPTSSDTSSRRDGSTSSRDRGRDREERRDDRKDDKRPFEDRKRGDDRRPYGVREQTDRRDTKSSYPPRDNHSRNEPARDERRSSQWDKREPPSTRDSRFDSREPKRVTDGPVRDLPRRDPLSSREGPLRDLPGRNLPPRDLPPSRDTLLPSRNFLSSSRDPLPSSRDVYPPKGRDPLPAKEIDPLPPKERDVPSRDLPLRDLPPRDLPPRDLLPRDNPPRGPYGGPPQRDIPPKDSRDTLPPRDAPRGFSARDLPPRDFPTRDFPLRDVPRDLPPQRDDRYGRPDPQRDEYRGQDDYNRGPRDPAPAGGLPQRDVPYRKEEPYARAPADNYGRPRDQAPVRDEYRKPTDDLRNPPFRGDAYPPRGYPDSTSQSDPKKAPPATRAPYDTPRPGSERGDSYGKPADPYAGKYRAEVPSHDPYNRGGERPREPEYQRNAPQSNYFDSVDRKPYDSRYNEPYDRNALQGQSGQPPAASRDAQYNQGQYRGQQQERPYGAQDKPYPGQQDRAYGGQQDKPYGGQQDRPYGGQKERPNGGAPNQQSRQEAQQPYRGNQAYGANQQQQNSSHIQGASKPYGGTQNQPYGANQVRPYNNQQTKPYDNQAPNQPQGQQAYGSAPQTSQPYDYPSQSYGGNSQTQSYSQAQSYSAYNTATTQSYNTTVTQSYNPTTHTGNRWYEQVNKPAVSDSYSRTNDYWGAQKQDTSRGGGGYNQPTTTQAPATQPQRRSYTTSDYTSQEKQTKNDVTTSYSYQTQMTTSTANYQQGYNNTPAAPAYGQRDQQPDQQQAAPQQPTSVAASGQSYEQQQQDYQKAYSQWYANYAQAYAQISQSQQ